MPTATITAIGNDDYSQAGALFRLMGAEAQARLMDNIAGSLRQCPREIQQRQLAHFHKADPGLWRRRREASSG